MIRRNRSYVPHDCKWADPAWAIAEALEDDERYAEIDYRFVCDTCGMRHHVRGTVHHNVTGHLDGGAARSSFRHRRWLRAQRKRVRGAS